MKTFLRFFLAVSAGAFLYAGTSSAATLTVDATITGATQQFCICAGFGYNYELLTVDLPSTLSNLSLADYTDIQFNLRSQGGEELVIDHDATLSFDFGYVAGGDLSSGPGCSAIAVTAEDRRRRTAISSVWWAAAETILASGYRNTSSRGTR